jgi:hypothetical protein
MPKPEPSRSALSRLLERPDARPRVSRAVASLLAASVLGIAVLGVLIIWHLVRRGRLIREGLNRPRPVRWPVVKSIEPDPGTRDREDSNETKNESESERRES